MFFEHKKTYRLFKAEVPDGDTVVPIGKASVAREGKDLSIFCYGYMRTCALEAAETLAREDGVEAEVVDLRTLRPLDLETILASVAEDRQGARRPRGEPIRRLRCRDRRGDRRDGLRAPGRPGHPPGRSRRPGRAVPPQPRGLVHDRAGPDRRRGASAGRLLTDLRIPATITAPERDERDREEGSEPMATTIKMPQLGESVTEGTIERWLVKEGDTVEQYDPLFEVVTDKVNAEVPAEIGGTITKILVPDGETVAVGTPVAEIDAEGGAAAAEAPAAEPRRRRGAGRPRQPPAEAPAQPEASRGRRRLQPSRSRSRPRPRPRPRRRPRQPARARARRSGAAAGRRGPGAGRQPTETALDGRQRRRRRAMTPAVRRLVREHDIDIAQLSGSGAGGRVTRDDVLAFIDKARRRPQATRRPAPAPAAQPPAAAARRRPPRPRQAAPACRAPAPPSVPIAGRRRHRAAAVADAQGHRARR